MKTLAAILVLSLVLFVSGCTNQNQSFLPTKSEMESLGYIVLDVSDFAPHESNYAGFSAQETVREFKIGRGQLDYPIRVAIITFSDSSKAQSAFNAYVEDAESLKNTTHAQTYYEPKIFDNSIFGITPIASGGYFLKDSDTIWIQIGTSSTVNDVAAIARIIENKIR